MYVQKKTLLFYRQALLSDCVIEIICFYLLYVSLRYGHSKGDVKDLNMRCFMVIRPGANGLSGLHRDRPW